MITMVNTLDTVAIVKDSITQLDIWSALLSMEYG